MTPDLAAAGSASAVGALEQAWTTDPGVLRRARDFELSAWSFGMAGQVGTLGDEVQPDAVAAMLWTVSPEAVRTGCEAARRVGPRRAALALLEECACWGSRRLDGIADDPLGDLLGRVIAGADAGGMPVFAATRRLVAAMTVDAPGARVALAVHALSVHRAGAMLIACRMVGLSAVEASIAGPEGEQVAIALGWNPPFPPRLPLLRRYATACMLADRIVGVGFAAVEPAERVELVDRLKAAASVVEA